MDSRFVFSPITQIPIELEPLFTVLGTPVCQQRRSSAQIARNLDANSDPAVAASAAGLTRLEAENTFALSIVRNQAIRHDEIWQEKASQLKKSGLLTLATTDEDFETLRGMDAMKEFLSKRSRPPAKPKAFCFSACQAPGSQPSRKPSAIPLVGRPCHSTLEPCSAHS